MAGGRPAGVEPQAFRGAFAIFFFVEGEQQIPAKASSFREPVSVYHSADQWDNRRNSYTYLCDSGIYIF